MTYPLDLEALTAKYGTDKLQHGYVPFYERHLGTDAPVKLLEIGAYKGASLRTWADWFPEGSKIVGLDNNPLCESEPGKFTVDRIDVNEYETDEVWDFIIDDGSHFHEDILAAFGRLWPSLRRGGWYVIEDLDAQWDPNYHGSPKGSPVIDYLAQLAYDIVREDQHLQPEAVTEVHLYRQIAFLRKSYDLGTVYACHSQR